MRFFKHFVNHPQLHTKKAFEEGSPNNVISDHSIRHLYKLAKKSHIFIAQYSCIKSILVKKDYQDTLDSYSLAGLPFKTCWFELAIDPNAKSQVMYFNIKGEDGSDLKIAIIGMLVHEVSPNVFDVFCLEMNIKDIKTKGAFHLNIELNTKQGLSVSVFRKVSPFSSEENKYHAFPFMMLKAFLISLNRDGIATEKTNRSISYKNPCRKGKEKKIVNQIVRIYPKKLKGRLLPITKKGIIDWSHRWESRGHWRDTKGIGKDREGIYCMNGKTWVKESVKGPEGKPLIKKVRLVLEEK